ncbi:MAG: nuclear transport factor 2 family protein, partial [Candidatus Krumholzibacteriota bacterium]
MRNMILALAILMLPVAVFAADPVGDDAAAQVRAVILQGEAAWNEGSIEGYMETYWKSPELRFASGGKVTHGWQKTLDGYLKRYPDRAAMGRLVFSDLDITVLGEDSALAFGAWRLERENDQPHGLFTLLLHRFDETWRIV